MKTYTEKNIRETLDGFFTSDMIDVIMQLLEFNAVYEAAGEVLAR